MIGTVWLTRIFPGSKKLVRVEVLATSGTPFPGKPIRVRMLSMSGKPTRLASWWVRQRDLWPYPVAPEDDR